MLVIMRVFLLVKIIKPITHVSSAQIIISLLMEAWFLKQALLWLMSLGYTRVSCK